MIDSLAGFGGKGGGITRLESGGMMWWSMHQGEPAPFGPVTVCKYFKMLVVLKEDNDDILGTEFGFTCGSCGVALA